MQKETYMDLGFPEIQNVLRRQSIESLYPKANRTGIYLLEFPDGSYYIGQAQNVVRRFAEHRKNFGEISGFSFMRVAPSLLNEVERHCIGALEHKCFLRNILFVSSPILDSDLDSVISPDQQTQWLSAARQEPTIRKRTENDELRKKYAGRFQRLRSDEEFVHFSLPVMQKYARYCILEPYRTEISFWGCSCLPRCYNPDVQIHSRINIYWQEVFYAGFDTFSCVPVYGFFVTKSELTRKDIARFKKTCLTFELHNIAHLHGGADQCHLCVYALEDALWLLNDPVFLHASKTFNLSNMRKGVLVYSRCHCMDLADCLLS